MTKPVPAPLNWRKAMASQGSQGCVELAPLPGGLAIRDSKNPDGPQLVIGTEVAQTVFNAIKLGRPLTRRG